MTEDFLTESMEARGSGTIFSFTERKTVNPKSYRSENTLWEWRRSQNILRWRKIKRICHKQTYPKRMAEGSSLKIKEMIKEGILKHQEGRKSNGKHENMNKYDRFFFVLLVF